MVTTRDSRVFVCVHGHFYQPPRENPWLGAIERQPSAAPYHDWNERITAECYQPNARARVLNREGRIAQLRNNYAWISFNFGPTLLQWLQRKAPDVYSAIREADRESQARLGHGNAIAQVYGHAILPLAGARDQRTQVRWGIADFEARFGRKPRGMWLPETAVDLASLRCLAEEGIRFTVLAPAQAARVSLAGGPFQPVHPQSLDTTRPYLCRVGEGREMVLFFYDPELASGIAFGDLLRDGRALAARMLARGLGKGDHPLVHVAADGETYGHHHRFGDMALAAALDELERDARVVVTNYAAYLEQVPVVDRVEIHERTAWSCAHGLARWSADCPCHTGHSNWQHQWRGPLRSAFEWLKDELDRRFERYASRWLRDPWLARDGYVNVLLQPDGEVREDFLRRHARRALSARERASVWKLLEMQHAGLLMFTSCGWFFDDPSGLETTQVLSYAARATELAAEFGTSLEPELVARLESGKSNVAEFGSIAGVYRRLVHARRFPAERVVAHYAMLGALEPPPKIQETYTYRITAVERAFDTGATTSFAAGRVLARHLPTEEERDYDYVVLHFGGHEFRCAVSLARPEFVRTKPAELLARYRSQPLGQFLREMEVWFPGAPFHLGDLFDAARREILNRVTHEIRERIARLYERVIDEQRRLIEFLTSEDLPLLPELRLALSFVLQRRWDERVAQFLCGEAELDEALAVADDARRWGIELDKEGAARAVAEAVAVVFSASPFSTAIAERAHALLDAGAGMGLLVDLHAAQDGFYQLWLREQHAWPEDLKQQAARLAERLGFALASGNA